MASSGIIFQPGSKIQSIFGFAIPRPHCTMSSLFQTRIDTARWINPPFRFFILLPFTRVNRLPNFYPYGWHILLLLLWAFIRRIREASDPLELTLQALPVFNRVEAAAQVAVVGFGHGARGHALQVLEDRDEFGFDLQAVAKGLRVSHLSHYSLEL